jgi:hypothetical protein
MFTCDICRHVFDNEEEKKSCQESCNLMVKIYMEHFNLSRNEALTKFRMELL